MSNGARHAKQRSNRVRLKEDAVILLDRITAMYPTGLSPRMRAEIAEMRQRLAPPPGVKVRIIYTQYPTGKDS